MFEVGCPRTELVTGEMAGIGLEVNIEILRGECTSGRSRHSRNSIEVRNLITSAQARLALYSLSHFHSEDVEWLVAFRQVRKIYKPMVLVVFKGTFGIPTATVLGCGWHRKLTVSAFLRVIKDSCFHG